MKSKPPQQLTRRILRMVPMMSFVFRAKCCRPGPSLCSRYVWIWLCRFVPKVGSLMGMITISLLLANTTLLSPAHADRFKVMVNHKADEGQGHIWGVYRSTPPTPLEPDMCMKPSIARFPSITAHRVRALHQTSYKPYSSRPFAAYALLD